MTTDSTDAEAIARIIDPLAFDVESQTFCTPAYWKARSDHSLERATAILSYLASRREAQEPVAWRDVERKFYHSDWPLTKLLEARNGGLLTDEGEAWTYVFSHKDGIGGEYDLLRRREPAPPSPAPAPAGEVERLRAAIKRQVENIDRWRETGEPASPEESKSIYEQLVAALDGCCHD